MACGIPVIGAHVGGIAYTVVDGQTGLLVPPRDPVLLARALRELLGDPGRCRQLGLCARHRMETEFTWPVVASRTAALYDDVIRQAHNLNRSSFVIPGLPQDRSRAVWGD